MKAVVQRCSSAAVTANGQPAGSIQKGLLLLLGVMGDDTEQDADLLAQKIAKLRIFCDAQQKLNLNVNQVQGAVLCVSNFTLCAELKKGNRPDFGGAMPPQRASELYHYFCAQLQKQGVAVQTGVFGADMHISLCCDGPITLTYNTKIWRK